ncbi:MAG: MauE/DoxX family redox-associated membrane protein [Actinomycetota bacterium]
MRRREVLLDVLHILARALLGGLLLWAGIGKAFDRQGSILAVNGYDVLPEAFVEPVAIILPWLEILLGVLLVLGLFTRAAGIASATLMGVFIAGMLQARARGLQIDCGCFGGGGAGEGVSWFDVLRDVPLFAAGVFLAIRPEGPWRLDTYFRTEERHDDDLVEA